MDYSENRNVNDIWEEISNLPEFHNEFCRNSFTGFQNRLRQIRNLWNVEKYRIVFIGEPGKGKTTAICNWLNLLREDKTAQKRIENISLLATASGRTTVAEVHICQNEKGDQSSLQIEYMNGQKQREFIREYCRYYYSKALLDKAEKDENDECSDIDSNDREIIHLEIDRVIRNMAGLNSLPQPGSEHYEEKMEKICSFLNQFESLEDFTESILDKINLENRNCPEIIYDRSRPFENWISSTFREINDGKREDCSIAQKIFIKIARQDLDLCLPDYVEEVIDTIGLDGGVRPDLQRLMLAKDTICFLMDDLKNVPSFNIRNLLKETFLDEWDRYCLSKVSIFVKSPESELAAVNEAEGDSQTGMEIKYGELDRRIEADQIPYRIQNTLFADSCAAYLYRTEKVPVLDDKGNPVLNPASRRPKVKTVRTIDSFEEDIAESFRQDVSAQIEYMINQLKKTLEQDADQISGQVDQLLLMEKEFCFQEAKEELQKIRNQLLIHKEEIAPAFLPGKVSAAILQKAIDNIHWATIRKMNSLYGGYECWHTDIYTQIMQAGRECYNQALKPVYEQLSPYFNNIENEEARTVAAGYKSQFDLLAKHSTERIGYHYMYWALDQGFYPQNCENSFWNKVNSLRGRGYKSFVRAEYADHIHGDSRLLARLIFEEVNHNLDDLISLFPQ